MGLRPVSEVHSGGATVIAPFACLEPWDRCACLGEAGSSLGVKDSRLGLGPALRMFGRWGLGGVVLEYSPARRTEGLPANRCRPHYS